ncbi:hypothetical protein G6F37_008093 [Rhizopus arrhizus]|nr:hypothetical protein G6F38_008125 [Rhizopus arrhizus]KAG1155918.1 hypothetical protein G6F37_008093 [Rhizopus arrhizus]
MHDVANISKTAIQTVNPNSWDVSAIVDDYFLFNQSPDRTGHDLFELAVQFLQNFIDSEHSTKSEKSFAKKFLEYFQQPSSKKQFLEYYIDCERKLRLQNSAARLEEEVEIAGNEFVGDHLCEKVEKRKLNDLVVDTDTRPLKIQEYKKWN